ncbi:MAG TPA: carbamoyltransferase HypF [Acidimicrobiales bacterium]|nr:carbamoyltransferase HypF [Acidimicrobiales bacterium]
MPERRRIRVTGTVQGVGFRPFVYRLATDLALAGWVGNDSRGVILEAEGPVEALDRLAARIGAEAPPLARVESVQVEAVVPPTGEGGFTVVDSRAAGSPAVAVPVDVATCDDCLREMADPADRRFGYPFTNCTNCGPRYTIIRSIPYDRASTTMAGFVMCADCRREYEDPGDRRFHAEPTCCPVCGPELSLLRPDGGVLAKAADALDAAVALLVAGRILAVKGLGGYHLACDAADPAAVAELRRRKHRDDKPFALMVPDVDAARALCDLGEEAVAALASPRRPIVLAPRRPDAPVAPGVAPNLPELGLMLAYTPLHVLLMAGTHRALVMTSGNLSDEPIAHDDADALARLGPMVDAILTHDRAIYIRCDDSVVRSGTRGSVSPAGTRVLRTSPAGGGGGSVSPAGTRVLRTTPAGAGGGPSPAGAPEPDHRGTVQMVRRSRGYAPEPIGLPTTARQHVLAVGAELKSTVAVAKGDTVVASHHIGDLEHLAAYRSFLQAVDHLCSLTGVTPAVVAHDLHPEYLSTKFAADLDLPAVGVQHHHAHIASCLVEHGRTEPVLGVAFDGLGLGTDGTAWGGELLVADLGSFRRVGHLRTVSLPGGDRAAREPWRMAVAWLAETLGAEAAERYGRTADDRWAAVLALALRPDALRTSSAGRLFDAVAALLGLRRQITYEAQAAIELESAAAGQPLAGPGGYELDLVDGPDGTLVLDPSPLLATVVAEHRRGAPTPAVAAGFHAGLGRGVAAAAARAAAENGLDTVALSGGVFQNARLTAVVAGELERAGLAVLVHHRLPPNDGGVSVGQAAVAAWRGSLGS